MNDQYLLKHPDLFQYVIGISHRQFELLLPKFTAALRQAESVKAWNKERAREPGGGDSAYQGVTAEHPFLKLVIPKKKPPGGELTEMEKANNKTISAVRVRVEHPLAYLKHFNILSHRFRNRLHWAHQPFETLACLYNFSRTHR